MKPPSFPFTIVGDSGSIVFIAPEYYSQKNLHEFFLWHYHRWLRTQKAPDVEVFTDWERLNAHLEDLKKPYWLSDVIPDPGNPTPTPSPSPTKPYLEAFFYIAPSEPLLSPHRGDDVSSRGYNIAFVFTPDPNQPRLQKEVVLRGATWREGKYNLQTQEFPWGSGNITLTAYDIYNVEPSGRYYTFTGPFWIRDQKTEAIIFNILPDRPVPLSANLIKVLTDKIAYVYLGWMYSVTVDGGRSWHLWDAERQMPEWKCCDPGLIREIEISEEGKGVMTLSPDLNNPERLIRLRTNDFGQQWGKN